MNFKIANSETLGSLNKKYQLIGKGSFGWVFKIDFDGVAYAAKFVEMSGNSSMLKKNIKLYNEFM